MPIKLNPHSARVVSDIQDRMMNVRQQMEELAAKSDDVSLYLNLQRELKAHQRLVSDIFRVKRILGEDGGE